jgi:putative transposase
MANPTSGTLYSLRCSRATNPVRVRSSKQQSQMQKIEPFTYDNFYHVYNRGINGCDIFKEDDNFGYFLKLYDQYISPIAETFAWVLMPNHFHFLLRVKEEEEIANLTGSQSNLTGFKNLSGLKPPHQYFSNLFNAYSKAFNKRHHRHGALFERPFKRKSVHSMNYLRELVLYIHNNPVHHGFCEHPKEYPWSSYLTFVSLKPTRLQRDKVIGWFDDPANFKYMHRQKVEVERIEKWLELNDA